MGIYKRLIKDLQRFADAEGRALSFGFCLRIFLVTGGFQFVLCRRIQEALALIPIVGRPLRRVMWWLTNMIFGSEIALGARVGGGLYTPHPYGIVVGVCDIGENVTILQHVTIGKTAQSSAAGATICDNVMLSAGCAIIGDIRIGRGVKVGANTVVLTDVPDGATAVGIPARIITND